MAAPQPTNALLTFLHNGGKAADLAHTSLVQRMSAMKYKLVGTLFLLLVLTASALQAQNTSNCVDGEDTSDMDLINGLLQAPEGVITVFNDKYLPRLGDRASIALMRILTTSDLRDPQKTTRILSLIHDAFSFPQFITTKEAQ